VEHTILSQTVAVIIVNYNGGELLQRCLLALSKQTRKPDRILLVDNNSNEFSVDEINARFPQIEVIALAENIGFAAANNLAVDKLNDVEWVVLLNPDAYAAPDWLEKLLTGADQRPEFSFFGCRMLAMEQDTLDGTGDVYHVSGANWRRDHGKSADRRRQSDEILSPSGAAALFSLRLQLLGYRCFYIADAIVTHEGSGVVGKYSDFQVYYGHRNQVWVYLMNMPSPWIWIYLPQHLLYNVASILLFVFRGKTTVILRSKIDAIKGLSRAWQRRKEIQATSRISAMELRKRMSRGFFTPYLNRNE
jgi:GT2 family glycosyltransferase